MILAGGYKLISESKFFSKADLARRWDVSRQVVQNWAARHDNFPEPTITVDQGRTTIYSLEDVKEYELSRGISVFNK